MWKIQTSMCIDTHAIIYTEENLHMERKGFAWQMTAFLSAHQAYRRFGGSWRSGNNIPPVPNLGHPCLRSPPPWPWCTNMVMTLQHFELLIWFWRHLSQPKYYSLISFDIYVLIFHHTDMGGILEIDFDLTVWGPGPARGLGPKVVLRRLNVDSSSPFFHSSGDFLSHPTAEVNQEKLIVCMSSFMLKGTPLSNPQGLVVGFLVWRPS